jgi:hypothetical protein
VEVTALVCTNENFTENTHAVEIVAQMIQDAKMRCITMKMSEGLNQLEETDRQNFRAYMDAKVKAYESMEATLIKNQIPLDKLI